MKKQGDLYLKIVSIVLAGIVVAYLVLSVLFGSGGSSYTLETAVRCEAGDGQTVSGFVVREEEIITASQPVVVCALTEGERVGSGQRVADGYQTSAAREKRDRLTALQEQLSQLRYAASGTAGEDTTQTDDAIEKALRLARFFDSLSPAHSSRASFPIPIAGKIHPPRRQRAASMASTISRAGRTSSSRGTERW